jgi:hypothetical protein
VQEGSFGKKSPTLIHPPSKCGRCVQQKRGIHGWGNIGSGNWNRGPRRPRFSIHFDADSQELGQLFQDGFFYWIGQGVVKTIP